MEIGDGDWPHLYLPPTIWLCFLVGATISGYIISYERYATSRQAA